jgi:hypothetical protein
MYSLSIDYIFNRVYDVLLWFKYVWLFGILRHDPQAYLDLHVNRKWDGLRDRGWFDSYLAAQDAIVPQADVHVSLWQKIMGKFGYKLPDSDGDGIPDVSDASPYDAHNLTAAQLKERYQVDYTFSDHVRDLFGIGPRDTDGDGVPNSYETAHGFDPNNPDSDKDGIADGGELIQGTEPLDSDTDHDLVLDGRDEAPLDGSVSSIGPDTDGDGVSDAVEHILGTDITMKDTDSDGIMDNMDTYALDPNNLSQLTPFDAARHAEGLHFSIQNPVLSILADFISLVSIAIIFMLVYASLRWLFHFWQSLDHYDHHFVHHDNGHGHHGKQMHVIKHEEESSMPAGIPNLPIHEEAPSTPPTLQEFEDHPRFAIIKGYMSSTSEALWRIGIIEADNMLEEVLKSKGYQGQTVSELLKEASFKTVSLAWDAHAVRNRITHEGSNFELTEREAKRAFGLYESVFRELKAIR